MSLLPRGFRMLSICRLGVAASSTTLGTYQIQNAESIMPTGFRLYGTRRGPYIKRSKKKFGDGIEATERKWKVPEEPVDVYADEELKPGKAMLNRMVADLLKNTGSSFIIPTDEGVIEEMLETIKHLLSKGVTPQFIISACGQSSFLLRSLTVDGELTKDILEMLVSECNMTIEDAIRVVFSCEQNLAQCGLSGVRSRLDAIISCGIASGVPLQRVVKRCPPLLYARDPEDMKRVCEALADFFTRKEISGVISKSPEILLKSMEEIEEKYEYIYYQMCIEGDQFTNCSRWAVLSLEKIILRHEFLLKCGKYYTPDPKRPQKKMENPDLSRILDTSDPIFATQVAGVSLEEWIAYQAFADKQAQNVDKERPFERVKPSMRKAYERRHKQAEQLPEHVFDVSSRSE